MAMLFYILLTVSLFDGNVILYLLFNGDVILLTGLSSLKSSLTCEEAQAQLQLFTKEVCPGAHCNNTYDSTVASYMHMWPALLGCITRGL